MFNSIGLSVESQIMFIQLFCDDNGIRTRTGNLERVVNFHYSMPPNFSVITV